MSPAAIRAGPGTSPAMLADLQRVGSLGVGDPYRAAGLAEHLRRPAAGIGIDQQCPGRAVLWVSQCTVPRTSTTLACPVWSQSRPPRWSSAEISRGARPAAGEPRVSSISPRLGGVRAVQDPDVAGHVVDDPLPVGGRGS